MPINLATTPPHQRDRAILLNFVEKEIFLPSYDLIDDVSTRQLQGRMPAVTQERVGEAAARAGFTPSTLRWATRFRLVHAGFEGPLP